MPENELQRYAKETVKDIMKKPEVQTLLKKLDTAIGEVAGTKKILEDVFERHIVKATYDESAKMVSVGELINDGLRDIITSTIYAKIEE